MACTKVLDEPYSTKDKAFEDEVQEWIATGIVDEETNCEPDESEG